MGGAWVYIDSVDAVSEDVLEAGRAGGPGGVTNLAKDLRKAFCCGDQKAPGATGGVSNPKVKHFRFALNTLKNREQRAIEQERDEVWGSVEGAAFLATFAVVAGFKLKRLLVPAG